MSIILNGNFNFALVSSHLSIHFDPTLEVNRSFAALFVQRSYWSLSHLIETQAIIVVGKMPAKTVL